MEMSPKFGRRKGMCAEYLKRPLEQKLNIMVGNLFNPAAKITADW